MPPRLFRSFRRRDEPTVASTGGRSLYAIGDVHGRLDLLDPLIEQIRRDASADRGVDRPVLIFVGDYIDRGASSRGVLDRLTALRDEGAFELRALKGNHEEALLAFLDDPNFGPNWCEHGGAQTLFSYGVTPPKLRSDTEGWVKVRDSLAEALPPEHLAFLGSLEMTAVYGDYVFVHAGLRPGVPLSAQREQDLLWIRNDFINASTPFEKIVVHGHTPAEAAFMGDYRIGIDTGAYATGVLTAVRLRDGDRRFIQSTTSRRR